MCVRVYVCKCVCACTSLCAHTGGEEAGMGRTLQRLEEYFVDTYPGSRPARASPPLVWIQDSCCSHHSPLWPPFPHIRPADLPPGGQQQPLRESTALGSPFSTRPQPTGSPFFSGGQKWSGPCTLHQYCWGGGQG